MLKKTKSSCYAMDPMERTNSETGFKLRNNLNLDMQLIDNELLGSPKKSNSSPLKEVVSEEKDDKP